MLNLDEKDEIRKREIVLHIIKANQKKFFLDYISYYYKKPPDTVMYAAQDTYDLSVQDDGEWLLEILDVENPEELRPSLIYFLSNQYLQCMTGRFSENSTVLKIMKRAYQQMEKRFDQKNNVNNAEMYTSISEAYAKASVFLKGNENNVLAQTLMKSSINLLEQLAEFHQTPEAQRKLADSYQRQADIIGDSRESRDALNKALKIYQKINDDNPTEESKKMLAEQHARMAECLNGMIVCDWKSAREHANVAVDLYQCLYDEYNKFEYKQKLAQVYLIIADICRDEETGEGMEFYQKALDTLAECEKESNSLKLRIQAANIYRQISDYYKKLYDWSRKEKEVLIQALNYEKQSASILESVLQTLPSMDNRRNLSISYQNIGDLYGMMNEYEEWKKAIEAYEKAIQIREELYKDASSEQDGFILLEIYNRMKELYQRITFGQYFDAEKLIEMYEKKMTSHEAFAPFMERKKAFSEVLEILRHMEAKYVDMIPKKLIMYFYDNCSLDYDFRMTEEIGKQKFMDETLRFLRMINMNFWKKEEPS